MTQHHTLLIVGGGAAGISIANNMRRINKGIDIAVIEPSEKHYYQAAFTIIGGGESTLAKHTRKEADLFGENIKWIKEFADTFQPEVNTVTLKMAMSLVTIIWLFAQAFNWIGIKLQVQKRL